MDTTKRLRRFIYLAVAISIVGTAGILCTAWVIIENEAFAQKETYEVTVVETSRYLESGRYAPIDTDGDSRPDDWVAGDYQEGQAVSVAEIDGDLVTKDNATKGLGTIITALLGSALIAGIVLVLASAPINRAIELRRRHRWREAEQGRARNYQYLD